MTLPFKFLDAYGPEDAAVFFGRNDETLALYELCFRARLLLVYGPSGTGKTSVINCGLASRFSDVDWLPVPVRRGANLNDSLAQALAKALGAPLDGDDMVAAVSRLYNERLIPVFLIFDQFEELFVLGTADERAKFAATLAALAASDVRCRIIISFREEYIANLQTFEATVPSIFNHRLRIEPMRRTVIESVINGMFGAMPGQGRLASPAVASAIADQLAGQRGVQLAYLQVYLDRLWRTAKANAGDGPVVIDEAQVAALGGLGDVMVAFLDEQLARIQSDLAAANPGLKPNAVRELLEDFVSVDGTKRPRTKAEVAEDLPALASIITPALTQLEQARILRLDDDGVLELAHDALARRLADRRSAESVALQRARKLVQDRVGSFAATRTFLNREELAFIRPFETQISNRDEADFIRKSRTRFRRNAALLASAVAGVVISLAALTYSAQQASAAAERERKLALAQAAIAVLSQERSDLGALLTQYALSSDGAAGPDQAVARVAALDLILGPHTVEKFQLPATPLSLALSGDGEMLAAGLDDGQIMLWRMKDWKAKPKMFKMDKAAAFLQFNDSNTSLIVSHENDIGNFFVTFERGDKDSSITKKVFPIRFSNNGDSVIDFELLDLSTSNRKNIYQSFKFDDFPKIYDDVSGELFDKEIVNSIAIMGYFGDQKLPQFYQYFDLESGIPIKKYEISFTNAAFDFTFDRNKILYFSDLNLLSKPDSIVRRLIKDREIDDLIPFADFNLAGARYYTTNYFFAGFFSGTIRLFFDGIYNSTGKVLPASQPMSGHAGAIKALATDSFVGRLVSASQDGQLRIWSIDPWQRLMPDPVKIASDAIEMVMSRDGKLLAVASSGDGLVLASLGDAKRRDGTQGLTIVKHWRPRPGLVPAKRGMVWAPDAATLFVLDAKGQLWRQQVATPMQPSRQTSTPTAPMFQPGEGLRMMANGSWLLARLLNGQWAQIDTRDLRNIKSLDIADGETLVAADPHGSRIFTAVENKDTDTTEDEKDDDKGNDEEKTFDGPFRSYNIDENTIKRQYGRIDVSFYDVKPLTDDLIGVKTIQKQVQIWDTKNLVPTTSYNPSLVVNVVDYSFTSDLRVMASVNDDSTVSIWDARRMVPLGQPASFTSDFIPISVAITPAGHLVVVSEQGELRISEPILMGSPLLTRMACEAKTADVRKQQRADFLIPDGPAPACAAKAQPPSLWERLKRLLP